jgi:hypothetical protein
MDAPWRFVEQTAAALRHEQAYLAREIRPPILVGNEGERASYTGVSSPLAAVVGRNDELMKRGRDERQPAVPAWRRLVADLQHSVDDAIETVVEKHTIAGERVSGDFVHDSTNGGVATLLRRPVDVERRGGSSENRLRHSRARWLEYIAVWQREGKVGLRDGLGRLGVVDGVPAQVICESILTTLDMINLVNAEGGQPYGPAG